MDAFEFAIWRVVKSSYQQTGVVGMIDLQWESKYVIISSEFCPNLGMKIFELVDRAISSYWQNITTLKSVLYLLEIDEGFH